MNKRFKTAKEWCEDQIGSIDDYKEKGKLLSPYDSYEIIQISYGTPDEMSEEYEYAVYSLIQNIVNGDAIVANKEQFFSELSNNILNFLYGITPIGFKMPEELNISFID